jgi:hypothetical protein
MHNFVALEEENEWLRHLDVDIINARLEDRRRRHVKLMAEGSYFSLSDVCEIPGRGSVSTYASTRHALLHKESGRIGTIKTCTAS